MFVLIPLILLRNAGRGCYIIFILQIVKLRLREVMCITLKTHIYINTPLSQDSKTSLSNYGTVLCSGSVPGAVYGVMKKADTAPDITQLMVFQERKLPNK